MRLDLDAFGDTQFSREILRVGQNAADMRPAFDNVHDLLRKVELRQFGTQGSAFSGGWKPLAATTVKNKAAHGLDPRILHATLRMRKSFTTKNHRDHVYRATADEMFAGSSVPYARFHQLGTKNLARRRPFELDESVRRDIIKLLQAHLVDKGAF